MVVVSMITFAMNISTTRYYSPVRNQTMRVARCFEFLGSLLNRWSKVRSLFRLLDDHCTLHRYVSITSWIE